MSALYSIQSIIKAYNWYSFHTQEKLQIRFYCRLGVYLPSERGDSLGLHAACCELLSVRRVWSETVREQRSNHVNLLTFITYHDCIRNTSMCESGRSLIGSHDRWQFIAWQRTAQSVSIKMPLLICLCVNGCDIYSKRKVLEILLLSPASPYQPFSAICSFPSGRGCSQPCHKMSYFVTSHGHAAIHSLLQH